MKTIANFILPYLIRFTKYINSLISLHKLDKTTSINSLAPKIITDTAELENVKSYLENLKSSLDTDGVNNIAITGGYGSGKSTILRTFQFHHEEYEYLPISLASFKDNKENQNEIEDSVFERRLEVSILQQIFYHVKPSRIPDSRFKRIINLTQKKIIFQIAFITIWLICILFLVKFEYIENLNPRIWSLNLRFDWFTFSITAFFFCGLAYFIKLIIRLLGNSKISKLNIKGELEIGQDVEKSVFNQHLEEILYFFERTKYNVVVIEDLDRFESTDIFTKLREINILINNSEQVERKVKFIYAIRDDMFKDANDRVKFFDFIIPVIPFINPSNASDQLTKLLNQSGIAEDALSKEMREDVCNYISEVDMRLLTNIFNEFLQYKKTLPDSLSYDRLFAMIIYKNLFPNDFGLLSSNKGDLYEVISRKNQIIKQLTDQITKEIEIAEAEIEKMKNESIDSVRELRMIYLGTLVNNLPGFASFHINKPIGFKDALEDDIFHALQKMPKIIFNRYLKSYGNSYNLEEKIYSDINFSSIENKINFNYSYSERERIINDKINGNIESLKLTIQKLNYQKLKTESLCLKDLLNQIENETYFGVYKNNYLLRYFLLNGYIDEEYLDYISVFHEISLTRKDLEFEKKIKAGEIYPFDYPINNPIKVTRRIQERYFETTSVLNYNVVDCLLLYETSNQKKIDTLFELLNTNKSPKIIEFINSYINEESSQLPRFIKYLVIKVPDIWIKLKDIYNLSDELLKKYVKLFFEFANPEDIGRITKRRSFDSFLSEIPDFIKFANSIKNANGFISYLENYGTIFVKNLEYNEDDNESYFEYLYANKYYTLNEKNIFAILKRNNISINRTDFHKSPFSTLYRVNALTLMIEYIKSSPEIFLKNIVLKSPEKIDEPEEIVSIILNSEIVSSEIKDLFLDKLENRIQYINGINEFSNKSLVFKLNKVAPTWQNAFDYYLSSENSELNIDLINFLNFEVNYFELGKTKLQDVNTTDSEKLAEFDEKIVHCKDLSKPAYHNLISGLNKNRNFTDLSAITTEMAEALIEKGIIALSNRNITSLLSVSSSMHIHLIEKNFDLFLSSYNDYGLDEKDWVMMLSSVSLSRQNKIKIIQTIDESIITDNEDIAVIVCNLLPDEHIVTVSYSLMDALLILNVEPKQKIILFTHYINSFDTDDIQSLVTKLGSEYELLFESDKELKFENNQINFQLFSELKAKELIKDFNQNKVEINVKTL